MSDERDLIDAFVEEGRDLTQRAERELLALSADPRDRARLDALFRSLHTLKGSAGLFDLPHLEGLLHAAETRLEVARTAGELEAGLVDPLARVLDLTGAWLDVLAEGEAVGERLLADTIAQRADLEGDQAPAERPATAAAASAAPAGWAIDLARRHSFTEAGVAVRYSPAADCFFRGEDPVAILKDLPELAALEIGLGPAPAAGPYDPFCCRLVAQAICRSDISAVRAAVRLVADDVELSGLTPEPAQPATVQADGGATVLRVPGERLDRMATLTDELVIARNGLDHAIAGLVGADPIGLRAVLQRQAELQRLVSALHGAVTDLRLVSLRGLFGRFPRQVREAARQLGKPLRFDVVGEDVVLDKSAVDALFEPLLHLLRNAVDHGLEGPDARKAAGKPEAGRVQLSARADGDAVLIVVSDDGRGVDPRRVADQAVRRGLMTQAAADVLDEAAAAELIFTPGFSTADTVGKLSGRGVGLDAVRDAVTRLGGRLELDNRPGEGLEVRLRLPARAVLTRVLTVRVGRERFAVPLSAIEEVHRVRAEEATPIRTGRAFVRREAVIPIVRLADVLCVEADPEAEAFPVLVSARAGERIGLQVDAVGERLEAPLRPLTGLMRAVPGLIGSVLEGDGRVLLVLDLAEVEA